MLLEVKTLKVLSLANNFIKVIPPTINKLENLTYLNLRNNRLAELPDSLFDLNQLTCLILSKNRLKQMPEKLYQLNLYQLDLSFNMIEMIDDPKVLTTIPLLNLNFNPIHTPPQQVILCIFMWLWRYMEGWSKSKCTSGRMGARKLTNGKMLENIFESGVYRQD